MVWRMVATTVTHDGNVAVSVRRYPTKAMAEEIGNTLISTVDRSVVRHVDVEVEQIEEDVPL